MFAVLNSCRLNRGAIDEVHWGLRIAAVLLHLQRYPSGNASYQAVGVFPTPRATQIAPFLHNQLSVPNRDFGYHAGAISGYHRRYRSRSRTRPARMRTILRVKNFGYPIGWGHRLSELFAYDPQGKGFLHNTRSRIST